MEKWREIKGYEGYYEVSSLGRIRSMDRVVVYSNKRKYTYKSKIRATSNSEYRLIALSKHGVVKMFKVSRLVAIHFLKEVKGKEIVNHKDGDKHNDNIKNLEWCTYSENSLHAFETGLKTKKNKVSGVFFHKERGKWCSYLYRNNKNIFVGRFKTENEAIKEREKKIKEYEN